MWSACLILPRDVDTFSLAHPILCLLIIWSHVHVLSLCIVLRKLRTPCVAPLIVMRTNGATLFTKDFASPGSRGLFLQTSAILLRLIIPSMRVTMHRSRVGSNQQRYGKIKPSHPDGTHLTRAFFPPKDDVARDDHIVNASLHAMLLWMSQRCM